MLAEGFGDEFVDQAPAGWTAAADDESSGLDISEDDDQQGSLLEPPR